MRYSFFDPAVVAVCEAARRRRQTRHLRRSGPRFSRAAVWPKLLARAETVDKLHAICVICAEPATRTQRLIDGQPAAYDDPVVLIGAAEVYEARCRDLPYCTLTRITA